MRKLSGFFLVISLMVSFMVIAEEKSSDAWLGYWMEAIELAKDRSSYLKAIESYTKAIQAIAPEQVEIQLNLINERGSIYFKMLDFSLANEDYSFVLNHPKVNQEQKIEALYGRAKTNLARGKVQEFEADNNLLDQLEPFVTYLFDNKDYIVLKAGPYVLQNSQSSERLVKVLLMRKEVDSEKGVTFTSSGLIILKKSKNLRAIS
jgi:tetratricopeptide (TPR) repeat protein